MERKGCESISCGTHYVCDLDLWPHPWSLTWVFKVKFWNRSGEADWYGMKGMRVGYDSWWRHQMETFSALLALCAGNSPLIGEFPSQRPVARSFDVFFELHLNKCLSKQSWGWWFETLSRSLWRHCNVWIHYTTFNFDLNHIWLDI